MIANVAAVTGKYGDHEVPIPKTKKMASRTRKISSVKSGLVSLITVFRKIRPKTAATTNERWPKEINIHPRKENSANTAKLAAMPADLGTSEFLVRLRRCVTKPCKVMATAFSLAWLYADPDKKLINVITGLMVDPSPAFRKFLT
jgi:hypothetical protein